MSDKRSVLVAVPVVDEHFSGDEEVSWRQLVTVLGERPRTVFGPRKLRARLEALAERPLLFDDECFLDRAAYSRLLLTPSFYRRLEPFEFVLIYQLDCLVFRDSLDRFCGLGYDYIGAPWVTEGSGRRFSRVGNGGLSLRRVAACLRVLETPQGLAGRIGASRRALAGLPEEAERGAHWKARRRVAMAALRGVGYYASHYSFNEDRFWSDRAPIFDRDFRVADVDTGLRFSLEREPREGLRYLGGDLPFGCHAWATWGRELWLEVLAGVAAEPLSQPSPRLE